MTKDKEGPEDRQGAVYKIKCCDYQTTNIGETGGNLSMWLPNTSKWQEMVSDVYSHIAEHHL